jgi:serine O-acetyltransferase
MTAAPKPAARGGPLHGVLSELGSLQRSDADHAGRRSASEIPSRATVAAIVEGLVAALYPRHFGPPRGSGKSADAFVADAIETALFELARQIGAELELGSAYAALAPSDRDARAAVLVERFARALPGIRRLLDSDILAAFEGDPAAKSIDEVILCYPGVAAITRHRLAHQLYGLGLTLLARIVGELSHSQTGIDIHPGAVIGERFFIDHGTGVVIGETARIGRNVRLYQAVTLGAKRFEVDDKGVTLKGEPRHPIVEDDVVIYAGATVLGRITIGRGSIIGGSVWLTQSVPPGSVVTQAKARSESFDSGAGI